AGAEKEILHLPGKILPGPLVGQIQPVFIDQHGLVLHPRRPGLLADRGVDPLPQVARVGRVVHAFGFALQVAALNRSRHWFSPRIPVGPQPSFLTNTWERRSQLYLRLRASGSQSGSTWTKPRLMNQ